MYIRYSSWINNICYLILRYFNSLDNVITGDLIPTVTSHP